MTHNNIQAEAMDRAHRRLEDHAFRLAQLNRILAPMKTYTGKVINVTFWNKFFKVPARIDNEGHEWREYNEFTISAKAYSHEKGPSISLGRSEHVTAYDGTANEWGKRYGDFYKVVISSTYTADIIKDIEAEILMLEGWKKETEAELQNMGKINEEELKADLIAVFKKHKALGVWDKILDSSDLREYNLGELLK